jgi:UDP-GlcNAc:undecaprenyl-phosphate GlcNAc-1-phosphate transferase
MDAWLAFTLVFILSFGTSLALVPLARWLSFRFRVLSVPGGRRAEKDPMPKLGSIALVGGFTVAAIAAQVLPIPRYDAYETVRFVGLLAGGVVVFLLGVVDDVRELSYFPQAVGQILVASVAILFQIFIEYFTNPFTGLPTPSWDYTVTVLLTLLWFGMMMNTVNFLDGIDGLAAGVVFIACVMLFVHSAWVLEPPQLSVSMLPLAMAGACLGFLVYNFYPAKIYMGGGALYLGFQLGALSIIGGAKMATVLLVIGLPLMDLAWQAFNRLRHKRNPFQGDRGHVHFRLLDSGLMTHRQIALTYYVFCAFFGMLAIMLDSQLYKLIALVVMVVLIVVGFAVIARIKPLNYPPSP